MDTDVLLAAETTFRPQIIEAGYRRNGGRSAIRAGWPWTSPRWRIWQIEDGVGTWQHGHERWRCTAGMWVVHPADRIASEMSFSPGSRWGQLRFACCPDDPAGDPMPEAAWGVSLPLVLSADEAEPLLPAFTDILAWWWRDPWHRIRAETRLLGMLTHLAGMYRRPGDVAASARKRDPFQAADRLWQTRPLASLAELAAACGMSERHFSRRFRERRGRSPVAFAKTVMANQACDLLRLDDAWPVERIARHLGYAHASTFIRAFTAEVGQTPDRWRRARHPS